MSSQDRSSYQDTVDRINAQGFEDLRQAFDGYHRQVVISPVLRWYTRYVASVGASKATPEAQRQIRSLTTALSLATGRDFATGLWINKNAISLDSSTERSMNAAYADAVSLPWNSAAATPAPVDLLMQNWVLAHNAVESAIDQRSVSQLIDGMNFGRYYGAPANHPFNTLSAILLRASFAANAPRLQFMYEGLRGERIESETGGVVLYNFTGDIDAIERFQRGMTVASWKQIESASGIRGMSSHNPPVLVAESDSAFDPLVVRSFGAWLNRPFTRSAIERLTLDVEDNTLTLRGLTGVEGLGGEPHGINVDANRGMKATVKPKQSGIIVLADAVTQAILFVCVDSD